MTSYPTPPGASQQVYVTQPAPNNGLGIAGFIVSLVGLISCGFLSPIGLILSLIALMKPPRGFAVAGTIIGVVGSIVLAVVGVGIVLSVLGIGIAAKQIQDLASAHGTARQAYLAVEAARGKDGSPPTQAAGAAIVQKFIDPWNNPFRFKLNGSSYEILSDGRDGEAGTTDDLDFNVEMLKFQSFPTSQMLKE